MTDLLERRCLIFMTRILYPILYAIFFFSGAAALLFETLWFRQAGLTFGNSITASSLVLAAFMGGLALGNGLSARLGRRIARPVRIYALLEIAIALSGVAIVWMLPAFTAGLSVFLASFLDSPLLLNALRLLLSFAILIVPTTAMGATLPILVRALRVRDDASISDDEGGFGIALGRLYACNTLGAVVGAVAGEVAIIEWIGVRGTAWVAALLDIIAAGGAFGIARYFSGAREGSPPKLDKLPTFRAGCLLGAAFLSGAILLALEVIWFRFLHLFVPATTLAFAVMLSVVLTGIGVGGELSARWLRRNAGAFRVLPALALSSGILTVVTYLTFVYVVTPFGTGYIGNISQILTLSLALMFPVSLLSGVLFTFIGAALNRHVQPDTRAAGLLTLANTIGAGLGALIAGFGLLPILGMEIAIFILALCYGVVAFLVSGLRRKYRVYYVLFAAYLLILVLFPFGRMENTYFTFVAQRFGYPDTWKIAGTREGCTETIIYLEGAYFGVPVAYQMLTDGFSMASSSLVNRRYMKLYVYWPVALHPDLKSALLISFGVGSTAKALTDTRSLEHIDVVDISRDVLEMNRIVYPDPNAQPLKDPRVRVHIDDGRYFLQTTQNRYDLITSEPPPPRQAGVVNLYSQEYFQLIYDRLSEGGLCTYWLPVHHLKPEDTKAIIRAFCNVFKDASLWAGAGFNWMLAGSRNASYSPSENSFSRQWHDPVVRSELRALGLERPEQLGALFMSDADHLNALTRDTPPLVDNYPKRLSVGFFNREPHRTFYDRWMNPLLTRERFEKSTFIRKAWPYGMRRRTLDYFEAQRLLEASLISQADKTRDQGTRIATLHTLLTQIDLRTLPLWHLQIQDDLLYAVDTRLKAGEEKTPYLPYLSARALAERDYTLAARYYAQSSDPTLRYLYLYALCMAGNTAEVERLAAGWKDQILQDTAQRFYYQWLAQTFDLNIPIP